MSEKRDNNPPKIDVLEHKGLLTRVLKLLGNFPSKSKAPEIKRIRPKKAVDKVISSMEGIKPRVQGEDVNNFDDPRQYNRGGAHTEEKQDDDQKKLEQQLKGPKS